MWTAQAKQVAEETTQYQLSGVGGILSFGEVVGLWQSSGEFREFFAGVLTDAPIEAYFWEVAPVTEGTMGSAFEFVLVEGGALLRQRVSPAAFREHFEARPGEQVVTFPNLGGDAVLVAPAAVNSDTSCYGHLAAFLRGAPGCQVDAFWRCVGEAMADHISERPIWMSTAGLGVPWLHLRLDSRPKYYRHRAYARR